MKNKRLKTVRPGQVKVGDLVLSNVGAINLPPKTFVVKQVDELVADNFRPGLFLQSILVEDSNGHGGWETVWDRPEAVGPIFLV